MAKRYGGRWVVKGSVGEGGQAHVLLVEDENGEHPGRYALKRLKNPERLPQFRREVEATTSLHHPNILRIVDVNLDDGTAYYVAEYCERGSLAADPASYRANITQTVETILPILNALEAAVAAPSSVARRDVKPENILIRADGTVVLGAFGICHIEGGARLTLSDRAMGSTNYVAPEMEAGRHGRVSGAVDIYAVGKVLYWMLSGGHIFTREDHRGGGRYLVERLGEQRWEHIHGLLDGKIVEDPQKRHPIQLLPTMIREAFLVQGDFVPLRPSVGLQCRWCGKGKYRPKTYERGFVDWVRSSDLKWLKCTYCGRLELFDVEGITDRGWFDR